MLEIRKADRGTEHDETLEESRKECVTFSCPVCGKPISEPHLPDIESVITHGLYSVEYNRILNTKAVLRHEFFHYYDEEEDIGLEKPHSVVAVISAEFDGTGECIAFDILEIRPCDKDSLKEMEVEDGQTKVRRWNHERKRKDKR